jgi:DNA-binding IclR family transcriptional regulator
MPKSTVHKHIETLRQTGYVIKIEKKYRLSPKFIQMGAHARESYGIFEDSEERLISLAETTDEVAGMLVGIQGRGIDVLQYNARERGLTELNDPRLHCSAPGKAVLASLSDPEIAEVIETHGLDRVTRSTITEEHKFYEEISRIQERGIAFERGEQIPNVRSVAALIRSGLAELPAAVYVAGPKMRMSGKRFEEDIPGILSNTISQIENDLTTRS